ncbi:response regulator [Paenibacillus soyae]|uniref:Response regulator transcription factor n=1 Tax=Paenibacillus soyae TaxID=2969249 RepID=A0A9X2MUC6_9BACL|nr:response regulator transcription factor [Paenibacillus soyae]MCR2805951.1 response regulator transcription factor [Paenibacillus soyae]
MNILIVDDHPLYRNGIRNLIQATDDLTVAGEAGSGEEAIELAEQLRPDLVLMDIRLPGMDGIEATRIIKQRFSDIHVLVLSMHKDDQSVFPAIKAGARGYLPKESDGAELLQTIRMVGNGSAVFGPDIALRLASYFEDPPEPEGTLFDELTGREKEVLQRLAAGDSNAQIAAKLGLSVKTVANNVTNILNKLQVADRHEARLLAKTMGEAGLGE